MLMFLTGFKMGLEYVDTFNMQSVDLSHIKDASYLVTRGYSETFELHFPVRIPLTQAWLPL